MHFSRWRRQLVANFGHRVRNRQPEGGLTGLGRSPSSRIRLRVALAWRGSGSGIADSSACVYGCAGRLEQLVAVGAISTILPRYITATRSEMCRTTDRSWAMNR